MSVAMITPGQNTWLEMKHQKGGKEFNIQWITQMGGISCEKESTDFETLCASLVDLVRVE